MRRIALLGVVLVLLAVAVVPASAEDDGPDVARQGQSRVGVPEGSSAGVEAAGVGTSALSNAEVGPAGLTIYMWTNLMRKGSPSLVHSQGWTSGSNYIPRAVTKNYLCKWSTCTAWCRKATSNCRWQWCGWKKGSSTTWSPYYTRTMHKYKVGGVWYTRYTEWLARF
jgi:hypothetical protein